MRDDAQHPNERASPAASPPAGAPPRSKVAQICRAARLLGARTPPDAAAQAVGVRPRTLAGWAADPDFRALVDCLREHHDMRDTLNDLAALAPDAVEALRRALDDTDSRIAVQAARDVLDRVGIMRRQGVVHDDSSATTIRVEYVNPDHHALSSTPWADRHPATPGTLQSGGVRETLRQDGDGQDSAG